MASYFDLPPQEKAAAASIDEMPEDARKQLGKLSLLSPQVTRLLEDLGDERSSSSEEGSLSEEEDLTNINTKQHDSSRNKLQDKKKQCPQAPPVPSSLSPRRNSPKFAPKKGSSQLQPPKQPHMARFHSLRSMLFSANLEDRMKAVTQEDREKEEAASKWKHQHEERQMHRPKTPEKDGEGKDGFGSRIKTRLRRMTSKEVPTMGQISEDEVANFDDNASTASSDAEYEQHDMTWKHRDPDEESINHSDVEDLVRWVSRQDPPSDGEARKGRVAGDAKKDSGHESLGNSDVEDLVRFVSRRSDASMDQARTGYSDASTETDSEQLAIHSSEQEDADDLVRWISHRNGPNAGPARRKLQTGDLDWEVEKHYDSDVPELGRWFKGHDDTSGDSAATSPVQELDDPMREPERGRPRSRAESPVPEHKTHLNNNDVDELVRWVSRKEPKQQPSAPDPSQPTHSQSDHLLPLDANERDIKKGQLGMKEDRTGSLGQEDVDELVRWVSRKGS